MNFNFAVNDKLRHVLILGESKFNQSKIIQSLILDDLEKGYGSVYITTSQVNIEQLKKSSNNNKNIIEFHLTSPFDLNEEIYKIKELNLRALMDNGKVFVMVNNPSQITLDQLIAINKFVLSNIIEHAQARIDGKEYDKNHDLIDKQYVNEASKNRKPFFIYIEDCYQYLSNEVILAIGGIRLSRVGMIFGLISNGHFESNDYRLDSLKTNSGSSFYLKSDLKDIKAIGLDSKISKLKQNHCIVTLLKDGLKTKSYNKNLDELI